MASSSLLLRSRPDARKSTPLCGARPALRLVTCNPGTARWMARKRWLFRPPVPLVSLSAASGLLSVNCVSFREVCMEVVAASRPLVRAVTHRPPVRWLGREVRVFRSPNPPPRRCLEPFPCRVRCFQ
eukprot:3710921-Prymnesium_polylepis.1